MTEGIEQTGLSHCLAMQPTDPNNELWLYNWVLINWVPQESHGEGDKQPWSYQGYMYWYQSEYGVNNVEDWTPNFEKELNSPSLTTLKILREGTVMRINGGYGFRYILPGTGNMVFTLYVKDTDHRLTNIRAMRNIDRFAKVEDKPYMSLEAMMLHSGLSKNHG